MIERPVIKTKVPVRKKKAKVSEPKKRVLRSKDDKTNGKEVKKEERKRIIRDKKVPIDIHSAVARKQSEELGSFYQFDPTCAHHKKAKWMRDAIVYLRAFKAEGLSVEEIRRRLNIDKNRYEKLEEMMLESHGVKVAKMSTSHRYFEFVIKMEQCMKDLDYFIERNINLDPQGIVGAVKAKASILKDMIKVGQDLGIVDRKATATKFLGDINLAVMDNDQLAGLLKERLTHFASMVQIPSLSSGNKEGAFKSMLDKSLSEEIIDAEYSEHPSR